jgi:hypothetical protein
MARKGGTPENLKRVPKGGPSPNPNGRPRKLPKLDALLADVLGEEKDGIEAAKVILMALRKKAAQGDVRAAEVLLDRAYGKAKQSVDVTTGGKEIRGFQSLEEAFWGDRAKKGKTDKE